MRRYIGYLVCCGAIVAAAPMAASAPLDREEVSPPPVHRVSMISTGLSDEAVMVLAGTALIGLAAAVRRSA